MYYYKRLLYNPFVPGIIAGYITNNIPLALITTGLTVMLWGRYKGKNFIIVTTILLVVTTGNINFEIIYIFFLSLIWVLNNLFKKSKNKGRIFFSVSFISLLLYPLWKYILGSVPAQLLNEFNIAGELLLLAAILLNLKRGMKAGEERVDYLLYTFLAGISITANIIAIPFILAGLLFIILQEKNDIKTNLKTEIYYLLLLVLSLVFIIYYLPLNIFMITIIAFLFIYIYLRQEGTVLIETVYLSLLTGLIASRIGLLH